MRFNSNERKRVEERVERTNVKRKVGKLGERPIKNQQRCPLNPPLAAGSSGTIKIHSANFNAESSQGPLFPIPVDERARELCAQTRSK